jgi:hypothetical protein
MKLKLLSNFYENILLLKHFVDIFILLNLVN